jgi:hypothetical protein
VSEPGHTDPLAGVRETLTRRHFLRTGSHLLGGAALANLAAGRPLGSDALGPHFAPKAKRVIYLHMVGGPPQMDLFDPKPGMADWYDKDLPESVRNGQRLTTMTSGQARFPIAPSRFRFDRHGECGMELCELLPNLGKTADKMCFVRTVHTDAINHEPAITFLQTGNQITGRPCLGAWASYGLGSMNDDLPTFVVMVARPTNQEQMQAISARLWAAGALPGAHAGVSFRSSGDPILFLQNPDGVSDAVRRRTLDGIAALNQRLLDDLGDPETRTRMEQYELAYRMQASVPELADLTTEGEHTWSLYGEEARKPGTFANSALMARRMVERGVRFVQVYHNNWDTHANVAGRLPDQCRDIDRPCHALILDLERRGLLDETLIVWGGEFGRTIYSQGGVSRENYGRDHHPRCFTMWMAGGGIRPGHIHGETDEFSYNIVRDPVNVHDLHATFLHLLGMDHERLTVRHQGLDLRLTGVEPARPIPALMA